MGPVWYGTPQPSSEFFRVSSIFPPWTSDPHGFQCAIKVLEQFPAPSFLKIVCKQNCKRDFTDNLCLH